jgi:CubicO group peptidase (beta-lactamase class C family)
MRISYLRNVGKQATRVLLCMMCTCCKYESKSTPKPSMGGTPPKFAPVNLTYSDPNSPEVRRIVNSLDTFYNTRVAAGFNGSVLVASKGKILYERYFGMADLAANRKITPESPTQLASTSKPFTAGAICLLKDRGLLRFDDLVNKYITNFPYPNITIRNLLSHRSGLPDYLHFGIPLRTPGMPKLMSNDELLDILAAKVPKLNFTPDTRFTYCNTNYAVLASIVEKISGISFPLFMKKMLFEPLGMKNTSIYGINEQHPSNYCKNYKGSAWTEQKDMEHDGIYGDKGCYSTVRDMYKWDQALYSSTFLKKTTLQEAYAPYSMEKPGVKNYGLGWRMLLYPDGQKIIFHNGYWHGNNTDFYRFIDENFTIIVLGNKYNKQIYYHPQGIFNIIKGNQTASPELEGEE